MKVNAFDAGIVMAAFLMCSLMLTIANADPISISARSGNVPIAYVIIEDQGVQIVQNTDASGGVVENRLTPVNLVEVGLSNGVVLSNFHASHSVVLLDYAVWRPRHSDGIGVLLPDGTRVPLEAGNESTFHEALTDVFNNTDLNNYKYDDFSDMWDVDEPVFDLLFNRGFDLDTHLVVMERAGNSTFALEVLGENLAPIVGARRLIIRSPYDWDTGYANAHYIEYQTYELTVFPFDRFFESVGSAQPQVHGLRVYNSGEADIKLLVPSSELDPTATITVEADPTEGGAVLGSGTFDVGSAQEIEAVPNSGWVFGEWNDGNTENPRIITVPAGGATYTAHFSRRQMFPSDGETIADRRPQFTFPFTSGATWYRIWINRNGSIYHIQWIQEADTSPSWLPGVNGLPGGSYQWWVQPWGPTIGYGSWSDAASFTIPTRTPDAISLIRPSGSISSDQNDFVWQGDADATWYRLWIQRDGGAAVHDLWYAATGDGEIAVSVQVAPGAYSWWLQPWGPDGFGPWSGPMHFNR